MTRKKSFQRKLDRQMSDFEINNEKGQERGMHETWENRDACTVRYRNEGMVWLSKSCSETFSQPVVEFVEP